MCAQTCSVGFSCRGTQLQTKRTVCEYSVSCGPPTVGAVSSAHHGRAIAAVLRQCQRRTRRGRHLSFSTSHRFLSADRLSIVEVVKAVLEVVRHRDIVVLSAIVWLTGGHSHFPWRSGWHQSLGAISPQVFLSTVRHGLQREPCDGAVDHEFPFKFGRRVPGFSRLTVGYGSDLSGPD